MVGSKVEHFISNEDMTLRLAAKHPLFEGSVLAGAVVWAGAAAVVLSVTKATPPGILDALVAAEEVRKVVAAEEARKVVAAVGVAATLLVLETVDEGAPTGTLLDLDVTGTVEAAATLLVRETVAEDAATLLLRKVTDADEGETTAAEVLARVDEATAMLDEVEIRAAELLACEVELLTAGVVTLTLLLVNTLHLFDPPHMSVEAGHLVAHMASVCNSVGTVFPQPQ